MHTKMFRKEEDILRDPGVISKLESPFETHNWSVLRQGFMRQLKSSLGRTRVTVVLCLLKQHPITKAAALETYLVVENKMAEGDIYIYVIEREGVVVGRRTIEFGPHSPLFHICCTAILLL